MFEDKSPFAGLAPNLTPNPPPPIPEAPGLASAAPSQSPFREVLDVDAIIRNLILDRPLKLFIPKRERYPDWEFHIINSVPTEIADANNKGWRQVDDPELSGLFNDLVAGVDEMGKAYRPLLMARPKQIGDIIRKRHRQQLSSLYAGMDPTNREFNSKYAKKVSDRDGTGAQFTGAGWRIRV